MKKSIVAMTSIIMFVIFNIAILDADADADADLLAGVKSGNLATVQDALNAGATPNATFTSGDPISLKALVTAQVTAMMKPGTKYEALKGATALMGAIAGSHLDIVKLLIENEADVNATVNEGLQALYVALMLQESESAKYLIEHGADPNAKCENCSMTPLLWAVFNGQFDIATSLIEHKADVNVKLSGGRDEWEGWTALMVSAEYDADVTKLLIEHGANVNEEVTAESEYKGWTALKFAESAGKTEIVRILKEAGAK